MNFLSKLFFYINKPRLIITLVNQDSKVPALISVCLKNFIDFEVTSLEEKNYLKILKKEAFLIELKDNKKTEDPEIQFLERESSLPVLVFTSLEEKAFNLVDFLIKGTVVTDIDSLKYLKDKESFDKINVVSVGFDDRATVWVSDINIGEETNFKINYEGNTVPVWIQKKLNKEEIQEIVLAVGTGLALEMNLVEISQNLSSIV